MDGGVDGGGVTGGGEGGCWVRVDKARRVQDDSGMVGVKTLGSQRQRARIRTFLKLVVLLLLQPGPSRASSAFCILKISSLSGETDDPFRDLVRASIVVNEVGAK